MSPAALRQQLEREAVMRTLYEVEHVYSPLRIACELLVLRRWLSACRHDRRSLPPRLQLVLDRIPGLDEKTKWDEIARAGVQQTTPSFEEEPPR